MATRSWTELFFLDEAIALAAGHRPCFACRRESASAFSAAWATAKGLPKVSAPDIDAVLHRERLQRRNDQLRGSVRVADLPDGVVVAVRGDAFTIARARAFQWTEAGYAPPRNRANADAILTPPSTVRAIAAGYEPELHPALKAS